MLRRLLAFLVPFTMLTALFGACGSRDPHGAEEETELTERTGDFRMKALSYPGEVLADIAPDEESAFAARASGSGYTGMRNREGTSIILSPHFTLSGPAGGIPVYATPVYIGGTGSGALHSFASVDVEFGKEESFALTLIPAGGISGGSISLFGPENGGEAVTKKDAVELRIGRYGVYTLIFGMDQEHGFTLFVRPYADEEEEIASLRSELGYEHVTVLEPGLHRETHMSFGTDGGVIYMKAGAVLCPDHALDILSDADAAEKREEGAVGENALGLNRYPVINAFGKQDVRILGRGTVDMTGLDWHERRGAVFSLCSGVTLSDLILINPSEWATIFYRCENVRVRRCMVLGWKTNSDGFAVCNSRDVEILDSFARTGDDLFEVKTLGGPEEATAEDVVFSRCQAWGGKARCYGVTGETERDIRHVEFRDSAVIIRDATWDNDRIGSLVIIRETGSGRIRDITFRNIVVGYDAGRAVNCAVCSASLSGSEITGIVFDGVEYRAEMESRCMNNLGAGNVMDVTFRNVTANGEKISPANLGRKVLTDSPGLCRAE